MFVMDNKMCIAIDVGGSGGKMAAATYSQKKITIHRITIFENPAETDEQGNRIKISASALFNSIKLGLWNFSKLGAIDSMGIDTWGGSYAYLDPDGKLVGNIYNDRDRRTTATYSRTCEVMSEWEVFLEAGGKNSRSTILSQVHYDHLEHGELLSKVDSMLLMPSFLSYLFTGTLSCERTMSSITCLTDPTGLTWSGKIIEKFGLQRQIFPRLVNTGSLNGYTRDSLSQEIGGKIKVINTAGHDTAAALSILPDLEPCDCFISIGTTIVVGTISESPVMAQVVFDSGYRNSAGPFGRNLLRINISGFWIVNEILKQLKSENMEMTFDELEKAAARITNNRSFFDPKRKAFNVQNANMTAAIRAYCRDTGQVVPEDIGALMRCVLESFAMRIRYSLDGLKKILGIRQFDRVFVINGGVRNSLLMQIISDALDHDIMVGIPWASLGGNLVVQMCATGMIEKIDLADVCRNSFRLRRIQAREPEKWHQKYSELVKSDFYI